MTCTAATEPMSGARVCAELASRLPRRRALAGGIRSRVWLPALARLRGFRMPRADDRRDARPDPADARAAVSHYLSTHWVNR